MKIAIVGDFDDSENYPNTRHLIAGIEQDPRFELVLKSAAAAGPRNLYRGSSHMFTRMAMLLGMLGRAVAASIKIWRLTRHDCAVIYIPYPATFVLFMLSLLPRRRHHSPLLVMDCFISVYDTVVNDRQLLRAETLAARSVKFIERRALHRADIVITDTRANAVFLQALFGGDSCKWQVLNLCINENLFRPVSVTAGKRITVLFVGSFVPLQGAEVVAQAAIALRHRADIRFRMLGDGQTADRVQALLSQHGLELNWQRGWLPIAQLATEYANADICLGVFGCTAKAQRVLPYKVYMALACGKPVINAEVAAPLDGSEELPMAMVPTGDAAALAAKISELAGNAEIRLQLAAAGQDYYRQNLSNRRAVDGLYRILREYLPAD